MHIEKKVIECVLVSLIALKCFIPNLYFYKFIDVWLFIIGVAVILTLKYHDDVKEVKGLRKSQVFYRRNSDEGFVYGLLTVPTVLSVQRQYFDVSQVKSMVSANFYTLQGNLFTGAVIVMALTLTVYSLTLWSSPFNKTVALAAFIILIAYIQQTSTWINYLFCFVTFLYVLLSSFLIPFLLPESFTFGEVSILIQGAGLILIDFGVKAYYKYHHPEVFAEVVDQFTVATETVSVSWMLIIIVLFPIFYCMVYHEINRNDKYIYSLCFYLGGLLNLVVIFLPLWYYMMNVNPLWWLLSTLAKRRRAVLISYWLALVLLSICIVIWNSKQKAKDAMPRTVVRKMFHFIAVLIYFPAIFDKYFISFVSGVVIVVFLTVEVIRIFKIAPFGQLVQDVFQPILDANDKGKLIITHLYLVLGMALPLWLFSPTSPNKPVSSSLDSIRIYSGVISIGVGDSCASIFGRLFGKEKLPVSNKTWFGSCCCFVSQLLFVVVLTVVMEIRVTWSGVVTCAFSCLVVTFLEGVSEQVDNVILPVYMYILFT